MWVLKFKSKEEFNIYNRRCIDFKTKIHFYSQNFYTQDTDIHFVNSGIVSGEEKDKKLFFKDLQKESKITQLEVNGDFFISTYVEKKSAKRIAALKTIYNQKIIFLKPALLTEDGFEEWEIASFNRVDLEAVLTQAKELEEQTGFAFKLLSFKRQKVTNLTIQSIMPNLSPQQRKAIDLAIEHKYYGYPRGITLKELAKFMNISESTFQFHLAKAEEKLLPFFAKR